MNKSLRKKTKHAITMHYYQRLLSLHPVYLECKKIFEEGTKFNDVFVKRATHQDGKGRIDRDKILAEEDSDSSQLLVEKSHIHAAHIVGLGLNPNAWNHLRYERIYGGTFHSLSTNRLRELLAECNLVPAESNQNFERIIDRAMRESMEEHFNADIRSSRYWALDIFRRVRSYDNSTEFKHYKYLERAMEILWEENEENEDDE